MEEEKRILETKKYALLLGIILFSIPGAAAMADVCGIHDKRPIIYGCCLLLMAMVRLIM